MQSLRISTLFFLLCLSLSSKAAVTILIEEVGSDVIATATGSADLTDLNPPSSFGAGDGIVAGEIFSPSFISLIAIGGGTAAAYEIPATTNDFTSGDRFLGSTSSGGAVGVAESTSPVLSILYTPPGYISNDPISSSSTFTGVTILSMGLIRVISSSRAKCLMIFLK